MKPVFKLISVSGVAVLMLSCSVAPLFQPTPTPFPTATPALTIAPTPKTTTASPANAAAETLYADLLQQVKQADPEVDFTAWRLAYIETEAYDPYNFQLGELKQAMFAALNAEDYTTTLALAQRILEANYILIDAHRAALIACEGLGETEAADYHRYVLSGLIHSILNSGDGQSPKTAFSVIFIEEEYAIINMLGIENGAQRLVEEDGHSYDVFDGIDSLTNEGVTIYFNVDVVFGWLTKSATP